MKRSRGREYGETWSIAAAAAVVWWLEGFTASTVLWAAFFLAVKLDSVIDAIDYQDAGGGFR